MTDPVLWVLTAITDLRQMSRTAIAHTLAAPSNFQWLAATWYNMQQSQQEQLHIQRHSKPTWERTRQHPAGMNRSLSRTHSPPVTLRSSAPSPTFMPGASALAARCCRAVARLAHHVQTRPASIGCCGCSWWQDLNMAVADVTSSSRARGVHLLSASATPHAGICTTASSCRYMASTGRAVSQHSVSTLNHKTSASCTTPQPAVAWTVLLANWFETSSGKLLQPNGMLSKVLQDSKETCSARYPCESPSSVWTHQVCQQVM